MVHRPGQTLYSGPSLWTVDEMIFLSPRLQYVISYLMHARSLRGHVAGFTHMKLQKLLYYAQGYHLGALSAPFFPESIEAWEHGPVVREVWYEFNKYGSDDITDEIIATLNIAVEGTPNEYQLAWLRWVYDSYGGFTASQLRDMTHNETPWKSTYVEGKGVIIPLKILQSHFRKRIP